MIVHLQGGLRSLMYFRRIQLKNFDGFSDFEATFNQNGINAVIGPNGSGKTQLLGSILFSLIGIEGVDYTPSGEKPSCVTLFIEEGKRQQVISRMVGFGGPADSSKKDAVSYESQGASIVSSNSPEDIFIKRTLDDPSPPNLLLQTEDKDFHITQEEQELLSDLKFRDMGLQRIWSELWDYYCQHATPGNVGSAAEQMILSIAREHVECCGTVSSIPLLIDDCFAALDTSVIELVGELVVRLSEERQVILCATDLSFPDYLRERACSTTRLEVAGPNSYGALCFNGYPRGVSSRPWSAQVARHRFTLGDTFRVEEDRHHELKECKGGKPLRNISNTVDEYVVAYLNTDSRRTGHIYWGVRNDGTIVGVELDRSQRDELKKRVCDKLREISPDILPSDYGIKLHHIRKENGEPINKYIVDVQIPPGQNEYLYATGGNEVYVKTDAGKQRLTCLQIQKMILKRHGIDGVVPRYK